MRSIHTSKNPLHAWALSVFSISMLSYSSALFAGDRLLATGGVMQMEGAGGGGLTPWALISGYGTDKQIGGTAFYTEARTNGDFEISSGGISVGFYNRIEVSLSQQKLGLSDTVPGQSIRVNTLGVKLRLFGDAVYDQDTWLPQVSVGTLIKHNEDFNRVPEALGAKHQTGMDVYLAATKLYLGAVFGRNLLINGTLQSTKANQFGFLGFGGDKHDSYQIKPAATIAVMLTDQVIIGTEYRYKPDNLNVFKEENAHDIFLAWFPTKNISLTGAYLDLGNIANKSNQSGWYISGQIAY